MTIIQEFLESPSFHSVPDYVLCCNASPKVYRRAHGAKIVNYQEERYYSRMSLMDVIFTNLNGHLYASMSQYFTEEGEESYHTLLSEQEVPGFQQNGISTCISPVFVHDPGFTSFMFVPKHLYTVTSNLLTSSLD